MRRILLLASLLCVYTVNSFAQVSQKYIGRTGRSNYFADFTIINNGTRVAVGYSYSGFTTTGSDALIMGMDISDNVLWSKEIGTTGTDRFLKVKATPDGGFVAVGFANGTGGTAVTGAYALIAKFDASGTMLWNKTYKMSATQEIFLDVDVAPNGHIIASGMYNAIPGSSLSLVVDFDATGNILWSKTYDGNGSDGAWNILLKGNDLIVSGYYQGISLYDGYLMELDETDGSIKWARSYDFTSTLNGNTGQWPQNMSIAGNKIYVDAYDFDAYGIASDQHSVTQLDTSGQSPLCLEYKFAGSNIMGGLQTLVGSPTDFYLLQTPGGPTDYQTGNTMSGETDVVVTKIKSLTAANANPVYVRTLTPTGAQYFRSSKLIGNKIVGFGGAQNDPAYNISTNDAYKIEADTSYPVSSGNCAANVAAPVFANQTVAVSTFSPPVAAITFTNPQLTLTSTAVVLTTVDPCGPPIPPDTVINIYAAVLGRLPCDNTFVVDTATGFNAGDTVLMIQMKGAVVDSSNTAAFGNVLAYNGAGNYEYNVIKSVSGNNITLKYKVKRQYDIPDGKVQFVRVPNFANYTVSQKHTCLPWTGSKGGVFIMNVYGTLTLNNSIDVTGKGFTGGQPKLVSTYSCNKTDYFYPIAPNDGGQKGEGIATISAAKMYGRGKLANAGGGGNDHNGGGGGGSNSSFGGLGGNQFSLGACATVPVIGGLGGDSLIYTAAANKVFLGGGGGCGHGNDLGEQPGASGGGLVFIKANNLIGNSQSIAANGANAVECSSASPGCQDDGTGGGGGGGIIIPVINSYTGTINFNAKGGKGANTYVSPGTSQVAPGGGGGGGAVWFTQAVAPSNATVSVTAGLNGVDPQFNNDPWGAQPGHIGKTLISFQYAFPTAIDSFKQNAIGVNFSDSVVSCFSRAILNTTITTTTGVASYSWDAGVAGTSTVRNPVFTFPTYGTYPIKLIVIDSNGCKDSLTKNVVILYVHFAVTKDTTTCLGVSAILEASGGVSYSWAQDGTVVSPTSATTVVNPLVTTTYIVTVTDAIGCTDMDTATVTLIPGAQVIASPHNLTNCKGFPVQLAASGVAGYQWSPAVGLSNANIANPIATVPAGSITYVVTGKDNKGCLSYDSVLVKESPPPAVDAYADGNSISCYSRAIQLHATGATSYIWHPGVYCNDSTIAAPTVTPPRTTLFTVTGTDALGCKNTDTITIVSYAEAVVYMPNAFTPNGDHLNDDIRPVIFCDFILDKWEVFNRWGQSVYQGYNLNKGWDGSNNGQPAPMDVYMYYVRGKNDKGETVIYKGNITLIR